MKTFKHHNAYSVEEAVSMMERYGRRACIIAGGTDLLGKMKDRISPHYPEALVNIKTISSLAGINENDGVTTIGALTTLAEVARSPLIQTRYAALAEAAGRTASPQLRNMGTLAGNICQDIRCWYYRAPDNRFSCLRKGGGRCYAIRGDHRYHSIFGGSVEGGCYAVHPSDTAPALIALDARIVTSTRTIPAEHFFQVGVANTTVLEPGEIVTEIQIPQPAPGTRSAFSKFALRKSIDFPIANCAVMISGDGNMAEQARVCLNAVYVVPRRARAAENVLSGVVIDEETAEKTAAAAVADAKPMEGNAYIVQIAKAIVKRTVQACAVRDGER